MLSEKLAYDIALAVEGKLTEKTAMIGLNLKPKGWLENMGTWIKHRLSSAPGISEREAEALKEDLRAGVSGAYHIRKNLEDMQYKNKELASTVWNPSLPASSPDHISFWLNRIQNDHNRFRLPSKGSWDSKRGLNLLPRRDLYPTQAHMAPGQAIPVEHSMLDYRRRELRHITDVLPSNIYAGQHPIPIIDRPSRRLPGQRRNTLEDII